VTVVRPAKARFRGQVPIRPLRYARARRRREADLLIGNLLGSNLFNSLAGGAIVGLAGQSTVPAIGYPVLAAMVAISLLAWLLLFRGYQVTRPEGALLLTAYALALPLVA
jgi:cation:H+ antiporter